MENNMIRVACTIDAPIAKVWECWTMPEHIMQWCFANEEWHAPRAENDLKVGGKFNTYMAAKDGSMGFDFWGVYDELRNHEYIAYTLGDNRKVSISFTGNGNTTEVIENFEPEQMNPAEMQQAGWQAILNNFKKYTEGK